MGLGSRYATHSVSIAERKTPGHEIFLEENLVVRLTIEKMPLVIATDEAEGAAASV